jgi:hypothetical protein
MQRRTTRRQSAHRWKARCLHAGLLGRAVRVCCGNRKCGKFAIVMRDQCAATADFLQICCDIFLERNAAGSPSVFELTRRLVRMSAFSFEMLHSLIWEFDEDY